MPTVDVWSTAAFVQEQSYQVTAQIEKGSLQR